ncbi:MAG: hypothetical protein J6S04_07325 [Clostridia bacterium]|nr:hypothetical protein [Clostridia bacterium]
MAQQKKGLIARMLEGKERSEEYARSTLPTNRWQLFWDIFKGNFWKLVKVNLLTLLFFVPLLVIVILTLLLAENNGIIYPFGANLGVGYPAAPGLQGVSESLTLRTGMTSYLLITLSTIVAAVGLSGGMYVIRNMVWTEGIFVANDFWRGVKLNYKNALQTAMFFCIVFTFCQTMINISNVSIASGAVTGGEVTWLRISQGASYLFMTLSAMMALWMIALGVNYKMGFLLMVKNSFLMAIGTLPQTVFFGALAFIPFLVLVLGGTMLISIGIIAVLLFGISYALLVWLDFAQWVFDKYINPKLDGAKVGRGIYNRDGSSQLTGDDSAASIEYQRMILAHGRSRLVAKPIKPIDDSLQVYELPQAFTREDLKKLRESKQNIAEDSEAYAEEHKNDLRYVEYNRQFDERERALQEEDMKGKKKRAKKPPRILNDNKDEE